LIVFFQKDFDGDEFIKCIQELLKIDKEWIPKTEGFSAYIRPTFIATEVGGWREPFELLIGIPGS
jgi:branched-subunit amino acid aminotransferase/4-amino-4-deoxychorismate lyase